MKTESEIREILNEYVGRLVPVHQMDALVEKLTEDENEEQPKAAESE